MEVSYIVFKYPPINQIYTRMHINIIYFKVNVCFNFMKYFKPTEKYRKKSNDHSVLST